MIQDGLTVEAARAHQAIDLHVDDIADKCGPPVVISAFSSCCQLRGDI